jgi:ubiquinone/menaquinone biosynthesis C-methylase UbiE
MGFYSQKFLPCIMDWTMSDPSLAPYRQQTLSQVSGNVLEIGFGTGLNLSYYPQKLENLIAIDTNSGMNDRAQKRLQSSSIPVEIRLLNGESLPIEDNHFDSVVSTWTLCSIAQADRAIAEIHRVLKPGGRFCFIEHGLSPDTRVRTWQNRLNPLQKAIGDGCHLNRDIRQLVETYFQTLDIQQFYVPKLPKTHGYMYQGTATKGEL